MIELVPAIDLLDGKCVRLQQGDYQSKKIYSENPVEVAKMFEDYGMQRLHVVDLNGAVSHHVENYRILNMIASRTSLAIDFGGGVKSDEDLIIAFENGAQQVTIGSVAVTNPELFEKWFAHYGREKIILGADVKQRKIAVKGWTEESKCKLFPFLDSYIHKGVEMVICTDIERDGMLQGPNIELYKEILTKYPTLHLMASGGVSSINDIKKLNEAGVPSVIIGKALYENKISLEELEKL
jgi:phosphoribosylformimino-5-aminoimidazole carboxamide ribotide isomerase